MPTSSRGLVRRTDTWARRPSYPQDGRGSDFFPRPAKRALPPRGLDLSHSLPTIRRIGGEVGTDRLERLAFRSTLEYLQLPTRQPTLRAASERPLCASPTRRGARIPPDSNPRSGARASTTALRSDALRKSSA